MNIDHQENCEYRFSSWSDKSNWQEISLVRDKRKRIQNWIGNLTTKTYHKIVTSSGHSGSTSSFWMSPRCPLQLTTRKASPRLPIFSRKKNVSPAVTVNSFYQYHIHIRLNTQAVYAAIPGASLKGEGVLFQEFPVKIDGIDGDRWKSITIDLIDSNYED